MFARCVKLLGLIGFLVVALGLARGQGIATAAVAVTDHSPLVGRVMAVNAHRIIVSGVELGITAETVIVGTINVGDVVVVQAHVVAGRGPVATEIRVVRERDVPHLERIRGVLEAITESGIIVNGAEIVVTAETQIRGELVVGAHVVVLAAERGDESLVAKFIKVLHDDGGASPYEYRIGPIQAFDANSVMVGGATFALTNETLVVGELALEKWAAVLGTEGDGGTLTALYVVVLAGFNGDHHPHFVSFIGELQALSDGALTVNGRTLSLTPNTIIRGEPAVGDMVAVGALIGEGGEATAVYVTKLERPPHERAMRSVVGRVQEVGDNSIVVGVHTFSIAEGTVIVGTPQVGDLVFVAAVVRDGVATARYIRVLGEGDGAFHAVLGKVEALTETRIVVGGHPMALTDTTLIEHNGRELRVGATVFAISQETPHGPKAVYIEILEPDGTDPVRTLVGQVREVGEHSVVVNGREFYIVERTQVVGTLAEGSYVFIAYTVSPSGELIARYIEVLTDGAPPPAFVLLVGPVEALTDSAITVEGVTAQLTADTRHIGEVAPGTRVLVLAQRDEATGELIALVVESLERGGLTGIVNAIGPDSILVNGREFAFDGRVRISGEVTVGAVVFIGATEETAAADSRSPSGTAYYIKALAVSEFPEKVFLPAVIK